ncbi:hypothetical protein ACIPJU_09275 [Micrococcus endophyticus]|uniref:hypothetical protein n=1 Tax=Micrococcus endophyticus TaxID=455343 RepID=UPI00382B2BD9
MAASTSETTCPTTGRYTTMRDSTEWLYAALRPLFAASVTEKATFDQYFQDAEVLLNALALDSDPRFRDGQHRHIRPSWTGLAAVYDRYRSPGANPAAQLAQQAAVEGAEWGPVRSGLFGSSAERARKATEASLEAFTVPPRPTPSARPEREACNSAAHAG